MPRGCFRFEIYCFIDRLGRLMSIYALGGRELCQSVFVVFVVVVVFSALVSRKKCLHCIIRHTTNNGISSPPHGILCCFACYRCAFTLSVFRWKFWYGLEPYCTSCIVYSSWGWVLSTGCSTAVGGCLVCIFCVYSTDGPLMIRFCFRAVFMQHAVAWPGRENPS